MEHRNIGPFSVSTVSLGCNNFGRKLDEADSTTVVDAALEAGINFFDTADIYGYGDHDYSGTGRSEEFLGKALAGRRSEVLIATKFGISMSKTDTSMRGGNRAWVHRACEDSLRRLQTDYIDLYQIHRPDRDSHISETLAALDELVDEGKIRAIGCSNFSAEQLVEADSISREVGTARFVSVQNEYSLLRREVEDDVLPACKQLDIAFLPYFPLASGLLTGKYQKGRQAPAGSRLAFWEPRPHQRLDDDVMDTVDNLTRLAQTLGHTILDLAISGLLVRPEIASIVTGATSADQIRANVAAASWILSRADVAALDTAVRAQQ